MAIRPFYALLGLAGWKLSHRLLPPPDSYRVGPVVLFALTLGAVYLLMASQPPGRASGSDGEPRASDDAARLRPRPLRLVRHPHTLPLVSRRRPPS